MSGGAFALPPAEPNHRRDKGFLILHSPGVHAARSAVLRAALGAPATPPESGPSGSSASTHINEGYMTLTNRAKRGLLNGQLMGLAHTLLMEVTQYATGSEQITSGGQNVIG